MRLYLVVDGVTKKARLVQERPRRVGRGNRQGFLLDALPEPKLGPTEAAFLVEVHVPGLWGQVSPQTLEITLPTPIEVGISGSPVKDARHG